MQTVGTIQEAARKCQDAFAKCCDIERLRANGWAEHRLADFNLWASGIGALKIGRASLDDRLGQRQEHRTFIATLLLLLNLSVLDCLSIGTFPSHDVKSATAYS